MPTLPESDAPDHPLEAIPSSKPCLAVAFGVSAGGQQPLEEIFTALPTDCGTSFVVIMHLPPEGPSFLEEMLARYTPMDVVTAGAGMSLVANRVHVIPAGKLLTVRDGSFQQCDTAGDSPTHHTIDHYFRALAAEFGSRTVAVVLSGYGTDGSDGVEGVREAGGLVLVQEPGSALHPSMPRNAVATGAADFVLPVAQIAQKLSEIARGNCHLPPRACSVASLDDDLRAIFEVVKARTGHDFSSYKRNTVVRRIERRMAVNDVASIKRYLAFLSASEQEAQALGQEILIGVTSFFRDTEAFEVLRREIIPALFCGRDANETVRIWHACCATGEEVYSNAILIREYLQERGLGVGVQLFATDIDEAALAQARAGIYSDEAVANLGAERLSTFFSRADGQWQVSKELRQMVVFAHHSLIKDPPFSRLDLLVCRNFLIYLNADMQKRLISLFHLVLKPGGCLFLGSAETVGAQSDLFAPLDKKWKIFERLDGRPREDVSFPFSTGVRPHQLTSRLSASAARVEGSPVALAEKVLLESYVPPHLLVNERFEVVHVSKGANRFLIVPTGEPTRDVLKIARDELRPALRAAIYKAFADERPVSFRGVTVAAEGTAVAIHLQVRLLDSTPPAERLAIVVLEPHPVPVSHHAALGAATTADERSRDLLVRQLEEQLSITHEQLQAATEQLESSQEGFVSANEELMSINEEFQSANEELQSTNEELETSKEELQALNEELTTVNAELHAKVEELDQSRSDMENLLASSRIATLFLDRHLTIKRFTPAMAEILNLIPGDVGRPFRHLAGTIDWTGLCTDAALVLERHTLVEREVTGVGDGRAYLMRVLPYRSVERVDGVVVTLVDITERKRAEEAILRSKEEWERTFDSVPDLIAIMDAQHRIVRANRAMAERLGGDPAECLGQVCHVAVHDLDHPPEYCPHAMTLADGRQHVAEVREEGLGGDFLVSTTPLFDAQGRMTGTVHVARDISERKRVEERIRRKGAMLHGINRIFEKALGACSEEELGETCLAVAEEITGSRFGFIGEIGADGLLHDIAISDPGWELCTMFDRSGKRRPPGNFHIHGLYGTVLTEGVSLFTNEPAGHPDSIGIPKGHPPLTAFLGVPLISDGRVIGMIAMGNREGGYDGEDLRSLEGLAPAVVEAFLRKRAEGSMRRLLSLLERLLEASALIIGQSELQELLDTVADAARLLTGGRYCAAGHGYVSGKFVTGGASRAEDALPCPPGQLFDVERGGVYLELVKGSETLRYTDEEMRRCPAWQGLPEGHVPLRGLLGARLVDVAGKPSGIILVSDREDGGDFSAEDESILRQLAVIASLALQHIEAEAGIRERVTELERFNVASVGRELRMVALKREVNDLCRQLGEPRRYPLDFDAEEAAPAP